MRTLRPRPERTLCSRIVSALALAAICGAMAAAAAAQEPVQRPAESVPDVDLGALQAADAAPPGPLKIRSWNVSSSPYAMAMRKLKTSTPAWRTSFGAERRTVEAPARPEAGDMDADIVLLQGIINPRAMRRLFPARKWRLMFSPKALENLPKGSPFTAPVATTEIAGIAVRYREGLRVMGRTEPIDETSAGISVRVIDRGRTLWLASVDLPEACANDQACPAAGALARWRAQQAADGATLILGGRYLPATQHSGQTPACAADAAEIQGPVAAPPPRVARGENRGVFGCLAELSEQQP